MAKGKKKKPNPNGLQTTREHKTNRANRIEKKNPGSGQAADIFKFWSDIGGKIRKHRKRFK